MNKSELPTFKINDDEESEGTTYRFLKDDQGKLCKLGDGTFGVVYLVRNDEEEKDYAVKLLYDNATTRPRPLSQFLLADVEMICKRVLDSDTDWNKTTKTKFQKVLLENYRSSDKLILELAKLEAQDKENKYKNWQGILDTLRIRTNSTAVDRFHRESEVSKIIFRNQRDRGQTAQIGGTTQIRGGTRKFHSYPAYQQLRTEFDELGISVSDYALVMERYDCSLKDLLERGPEKRHTLSQPALLQVFGKKEIPELLHSKTKNAAIIESEGIIKKVIHGLPELTDEQKTLLEKAITQLPIGYELLRQMTFEDRIRTALPILRYIVVGLGHLHSVLLKHRGPLFHLDIKPANIFVKEDRAIGLIVALGDLGFLRSNPETPSQQTHTAVQIEDLPLGTLHYRSPEQKEWFDVANVMVRVEGEGVTLEVHDPKFKQSFIEIGDNVTFSKDNERRLFLIQDLQPGNANSPAKVQISAVAKQVNPDELTQVIFLKQQEHRTDISGVGAIAFDLISCGLSPERFYESIRRFEFDGDQRGDVEKVLDKYRRVKEGLAQADEPGLVQIFEPFRHQVYGDYAPVEYVRLVLKCMLYRATKTFHHPYESLRPAAELTQTTADINTQNLEDHRNRAVEDLLHYLDEKLVPRFSPYQQDNPLVTLRSPQPPTRSAERLGEFIDRLQAPDYDWRLRLAQGAYCFEKMITLVREVARNFPKPYLYQLLPSSILLFRDNQQSPFQFDYPAYADEDDYLDDLMHSDMDRVAKGFSDPFVPYQIASMRRKVRLDKIGTNNPNAYNLNYQDAGLFGQHVSLNDWLMIESNNSRYLWRIGKVSGDHRRPQISLEPIPNSRDASLDKVVTRNGLLEGIYYARLDPARYYLDALGLQLLNFLAVNSKLTNTSRTKTYMPAIVAQKPGCMKIDVPTQLGRILPRSKNEITEIFRWIAHIYLRLTWHSSVNSYLGGSPKDGEHNAVALKDVLQLALNDAKQLRAKIEKALGVPDNLFEDEWPDIGRLPEINNNLKKNYEAVIAAPIDIEKEMIELLK